jgi:hypothetical protein
MRESYDVYIGRPTPETDREEIIHPNEHFDFRYVPSEFARRLERQRNELLAICGRYLNVQELREFKEAQTEYYI